jgi:predicted RNA binding protein YcfA (HicA-like mRNA interferase family)
MASLPVVSGEAAIRAFERAGWGRARQKGSHVSLVKPGVNVNLSIPLHRELDRGTLRKLIRLAGLSVDEFSQLLR